VGDAAGPCRADGLDLTRTASANRLAILVAPHPVCGKSSDVARAVGCSSLPARKLPESMPGTRRVAPAVFARVSDPRLLKPPGAAAAAGPKARGLGCSRTRCNRGFNPLAAGWGTPHCTTARPHPAGWARQRFASAPLDCSSGWGSPASAFKTATPMNSAVACASACPNRPGHGPGTTLVIADDPPNQPWMWRGAS